ncbi:MAG: methyltransferase domain-containing protein [Candidatus Rokubacteria bacterium]|nr:methyltransferase domain-containing protein [Candidatus Rokubacteria bacterium]
MERWQELELQYARRLRQSSRAERRALYAEAYSVVSELRARTMPPDPEKRTAGTSKSLVKALARLLGPTDDVLEVGCGRGYTCLGLAPHARSIVGVDVSTPALREAEQLLRAHDIRNVAVRQVAGDELTAAFPAAAFDVAVAIDVYEHLHPEDCRVTLQQIHAVLRPGGTCIVVTPNRIFGPHDITRVLYPEATEPLGFHLNETTYRELLAAMREVGFGRFRTLRTMSRWSTWLWPRRLFGITYPAWVSVLCERAVTTWGAPAAGPLLAGIRLLGKKRGIRVP